jgi:hypothetical protein
MSVLNVILLVLFTVVMAVWLLSLVARRPDVAPYSPWLAFFACLVLGVVVFLTGFGVIVYRP